jgi:hypothetical protein
MADIFQTFVDFFVDMILFIPRIIFWAGVELVTAALNLIPADAVPDPSVFEAGFTGDLLFFLTVFEVNTGLGLVGGSLAARFLLRRIPLIG